MADLNWFSTALVMISVSTGICMGLLIGPWAMLLAVIATLVGTYAVFKFCHEASNDH